MTTLEWIAASVGLQAITNDMPADERCSASVSNIETLLDLEWRSHLLLGSELARLKWSLDFTRDTAWASSASSSRSWPEWLKLRDFRLQGSDAPMDVKTANAIIMWSVLYRCFEEENARRVESGRLPLPLPSNTTQLRPYATLMLRVNGWVPPVDDRRDGGAMEPPFAADQPDVVAAWEAAWNLLPPEKRMRKGEPAPPTAAVSRQYLLEQSGLRQLAERDERELTEAGPRPEEKPPSSPKRRAHQLRQDARTYRLAIMNLQASTDALVSFLSGTLAREGTEAYLAELRALDLGIYSVGKDVELLRQAVIRLQEVFRLATERYTPIEPLARATPVEEQTLDVDPLPADA
jgi:hypothetical protein